VASEPEQQADTQKSFAHSVLGRAFFEDASVKRFVALSPTVQVVAIVSAFAGLVLLPYLGAVGLWDPWEVHYGEVARSMIHRGDWVHMYWENGWLFSKPVMTMWLMALGMTLVGTERGEAFVALGTEWGMRLPFALFSIVAVVLLSLAVSRTVNRRAGLATGFVLVTMPTWFLISRQAVTDTPFVSAMVAAVACAIIGLLDGGTRHRAAWWYGFYVFAGIATLAKGPAGVIFPAAVLLLFAALCVVPWSGQSLRAHAGWVRTHAAVPLLLAAGVTVVAAVALEWAIGLVRHTDAGFFEALGRVRGKERMAIDAQQALVNGILAGLVAFLAGVGAFLVALRRRMPAEGQVLPVLWAHLFRMRLGSGLLVYFAVALPWFFYMSLFPEVGNAEEGSLFWSRFFLHDNINRVFAGVHTTTPGGTFTYFIEQGGFGIFPWVALVPGALAVAAGLKLRRGGVADQVGVLAVIWLAVTFTVIASMQTKFHHYLMPILPPLAVLIGLFIDKLWREGISKNAVVLIFGLVLLVLVGKDLINTPKHFTDLFVYNYDRAYPADLWTRLLRFGGLSLSLGETPSTLVPAFTLPWTLKDAFSFVFWAAVLLLVGVALMRDRRLLFSSFLVATLTFTLWFNWKHWVDLSHNWTQRDLFWRYYDLRQPEEPITAFLMNWRGETFYSRNKVKQIKDNGRMAQYAALPGRKWALVEHHRLGILKTAVGSTRTVTVMTTQEMNNKFLLVAID
jgi:4-amino-4-deoxy-L-arabinose transferase-like glycosyltransferase